MLKLFERLLPASIVARVFALYSVAWLACVGLGSLALYAVQMDERVDQTRDSALMMLEVTAHSISDSAVIGDYDTIRQLLDKALASSVFAEVKFIDLKGGVLQSRRDHHHVAIVEPPDWLVRSVADNLGEVNRAISVGGVDYGVLRMVFDANQLAHDLLRFLAMTAVLGSVCFVGGLLLIWIPLRAWLEPLQRARFLTGAALDAPLPEVDSALIASAPAEFRQPLQALSQATRRLRDELAERQTALAVLRTIVESRTPHSADADQGREDIAAMVETVSRMVSEQSLVQQELQRAKEASDQANRAKSAFLTTLSHELRTPLNGILGIAQLLRSDASERPQTRELAGVIQTSGQTLLTLLNDLLDVSRIEAGRLELAPVDFTLGELIDDSLSLYTGSAQAKGLRLGLELHGLQGRRCHADRLRIGQMLNNLISNSLKFTEHGRVRVEVRTAGGTWLEFRVSDTGIGIAADRQAQLFGQFVQVDDSSTRRFGGSGLGLSIVRGLATAMGGEVGVESSEGVGSSFWFRIPVPEPAALPAVDAPAPGPAAGRPPRVAGRALVVDDAPANRFVAERMLVRLGLRVLSAEDGRAALQRLREDEPFDLILMDIQMPELDGPDATRLIRAWEKAEGRVPVPIIAVTAAAYDADRERCRAAGMDDFLAKPIMLDELSRVLQRWLPEDAAVSRPAPALN